MVLLGLLEANPAFPMIYVRRAIECRLVESRCVLHAPGYQAQYAIFTVGDYESKGGFTSSHESSRVCASRFTMLQHSTRSILVDQALEHESLELCLLSASR